MKPLHEIYNQFQKHKEAGNYIEVVCQKEGGPEVKYSGVVFTVPVKPAFKETFITLNDNHGKFSSFLLNDVVKCTVVEPESPKTTTTQPKTTLHSFNPVGFHSASKNDESSSGSPGSPDSPKTPHPK